MFAGSRILALGTACCVVALALVPRCRGDGLAAPHQWGCFAISSSNAARRN